MFSAGGCQCGAVRFQISAKAKWCANCHCGQCQKAHGAGFVTWVGVVIDAFELAPTDNALKWYRSSPEAQRGFCSNCGSTLFFESSQWPGEMHIVLANFDDDMGLKPSRHAFFDTHVPWLSFDDGLARQS